MLCHILCGPGGGKPVNPVRFERKQRQQNLPGAWPFQFTRSLTFPILSKLSPRPEMTGCFPLAIPRKAGIFRACWPKPAAG